MNDTIYRRDAIQALINTEEIKGFAYRMLEDRLMEIPSADRPQGYYIKGENGEWYCSNCKRIDDKYSVARFCWWCGARIFAKDINALNKKEKDNGRHDDTRRSDKYE